MTELETPENVEKNEGTETTENIKPKQLAVEGESKPVRNTRKEKIGKVVSDKMTKSITVLVERRVQHPIYGKFLTKSKKFMAHDEKEEAHIGDTVRIMETRPLSKRKRWRLVQIIERAK